MTREQVQATMPDKFKYYCPKVRVIIDCTELRCETSSSLTLQSQAFSSYQNHTIFKGSTGIAPCGWLHSYLSCTLGPSQSDRMSPAQRWCRGWQRVFNWGYAEVGVTLIIPPHSKTAPQQANRHWKVKHLGWRCSSLLGGLHKPTMGSLLPVDKIEPTVMYVWFLNGGKKSLHSSLQNE